MSPEELTSSRSVDISAARAQVEAARLRRPKAGASPPSIPRYTILGELHRGGQGVVYLGVQESTDRRVAIKILDRARVGPSAMARFEREVEALSLLRHPHIVAIHDCGRDREQVYLVMDYVEGRPLDTALAGRPVRDVVEVFAKVCEGVNAAHLRGVIHRDLKPANIQVDEEGEPRVLDFGLAKLAEDHSTIAMTETGQFVGSMPWSSPEQAAGRAEELDVRTDVYSLGVVLYQLLTGAFPYPVTGSVVEVAGHIARTEPARPSARRAEIDRELETIVLKCLAKAPERRYQSAGELGRDLRRYLAGEPIEARRDSLGYVMSKRLARYRVALITGAAVLAIVTGALTVSVINGRRADRNARRADEEAQQARAVIEFMRGVLTSVQPENQGADVRLNQVLSAASAMASERFGAYPEREAEVRDLLGEVYDSLSLWAESTPEFKRAADLWEGSVGLEDPRSISSRWMHAHALANQQHLAEAEPILAELAPRARRVLGTDHRRVLDIDRTVAIVHLFRGRIDEAERMLLALRGRAEFADDDKAQARILSGLVAVEASRLTGGESGVAHAQRGEVLAREWTERAGRAFGTGSVQALLARVIWAEMATDSGKYEEGASACREILDSPPERLGACHNIRTRAMMVRAQALAGLRRHEEAVDLVVRRLECLRRETAPDSIFYMATAGDALRYLDRGGRNAEGETLARELAGALAKFGGGHDDMAVTTELYIAQFVSKQGRLDEAEPLFRAVATRGMLIPRTRARVRIMHAGHLTRRGLFEEAERELTLAGADLGDLRRGTWDSHPDDAIEAHVALYEAWGRADKAREYAAMLNVGASR